MELTQTQRPDLDKAFEVPQTLGPVKAWSYSALKVFEECPYRTYISRVRRVQEPSSPAADRGSQIHQEAEDYVNGTLGEFPPSLSKFRDDFEELRSLFADAKVELEGEWGSTQSGHLSDGWSPTHGHASNSMRLYTKTKAVPESSTTKQVKSLETRSRTRNSVCCMQSPRSSATHISILCRPSCGT